MEKFLKNIFKNSKSTLFRKSISVAYLSTATATTVYTLENYIQKLNWNFKILILGI